MKHYALVFLLLGLFASPGLATLPSWCTQTADTIECQPPTEFVDEYYILDHWVSSENCSGPPHSNCYQSICCTSSSLPHTRQDQLQVANYAASNGECQVYRYTWHYCSYRVTDVSHIKFLDLESAGLPTTGIQSVKLQLYTTTFRTGISPSFTAVGGNWYETDVTSYYDGWLGTGGSELVINISTNPFITAFDSSVQAHPPKLAITLQSNNPPFPSNVHITPSNPTAADDLSCEYTYVDPENDAEGASTFKWFKDGAEQTGLTTQAISSSNTAEGEHWKCEVTPIALTGTSPGIAVESAEVTIGGTQLCDPAKPCCEPDGQSYSSQGRWCALIATEYRCVSSDCGGDVERRQKVTFCSGISEECDGVTDWKSWLLYRDCGFDEKCNSTTGQCNYSSECGNLCDSIIVAGQTITCMINTPKTLGASQVNKFWQQDIQGYNPTKVIWKIENTSVGAAGLAIEKPVAALVEFELQMNNSKLENAGDISLTGALKMTSSQIKNAGKITSCSIDITGDYGGEPAIENVAGIEITGNCGMGAAGFKEQESPTKNAIFFDAEDGDMTLVGASIEGIDGDVIVSGNLAMENSRIYNSESMPSPLPPNERKIEAKTLSAVGNYNGYLFNFFPILKIKQGDLAVKNGGIIGKLTKLFAACGRIRLENTSITGWAPYGLNQVRAARTIELIGSAEIQSMNCSSTAPITCPELDNPDNTSASGSPAIYAAIISPEALAKIAWESPFTEKILFPIADPSCPENTSITGLTADSPVVPGETSHIRAVINASRPIIIQITKAISGEAVDCPNCPTLAMPPAQVHEFDFTTPNESEYYKVTATIEEPCNICKKEAHVLVGEAGQTVPEISSFVAVLIAGAVLILIKKKQI